jgi:hypothetical protein
MKSKGIESAKFRYRVNNAEFEIFFTTNPELFELLFGYIGDENFAFTIAVKKGFNISPTIEPKEAYYKLIELLKIDSSSGNPFRPFDFFKEFNASIPIVAKEHSISSKAKYLRYARDVDEAHKIHFCGWLRPGEGRHTTAANLKKTLDHLKYSAYLFCKKNGVSSKWTDVPAKEREYTPPDLNISYHNE